MAVMKETDLTLQELSKKGKNLGLSYAQTLSLFFFEKILLEVSEGGIGDNLWLKEEEFQILGKKKKRIPNEITYYMTNISYQLILDSMKQLIEEKKYTEVAWRLDFYDTELVVDLQAALKKIPVSFKIRVRPIWQEDQYLEEGSYRPLLLPVPEIPYHKYPLELDIVECLFQILDKLELIGDMRPFAVIYQILRSKALPGRHIYLNMKEFVENSDISALHKRMETVLGYRNYGYMKKRWNRYVKECGDMDRKEDSWERVMGLLEECFNPVWEAIEQDDIFIGDWMPQLGRYL